MSGVLLWGWDDTNKKWVKLIADTSGRLQVVSIANRIIDADGDTGIEAEQVADEDKLHFKTAGVECGLFSDIGILTLPKQSRCRVYDALTDQYIPTGAYTKPVFDTEAYDEQGEMDISQKTGIADATEANKLHDADGGFTAADVGKWVWNTTDNTYTTVSGYVDDGELDLTDDIMANGEGYSLYHSRFTAKEAGYYIVGGVLTIYQIAADKRLLISIFKNGTRIADARLHSSYAGDLAAVVTTSVYLAANDYLDIRAHHDHGDFRILSHDEYHKNFWVHKLS